MRCDEIILVPGFLGFQRLWDLPYFSRAEELMRRAFVDRGVQANVRAIRTLPTASLGQRAARLAEVVASTRKDARVHLVGHSTGGLDARLFVAPGATLPTKVDVEGAASRVRSVVSIATPHHGTPLATYMTGVHGHRFLGIASQVLTRLLRGGRSSFRGMRELSKAVFLLDTLAGMDRELAYGLGSKIGEQARALSGVADQAVETLLQEMGEDNALLEQLTPASLELFNNATQNRPGVDYGSVIAMAPRPSVRRRIRVGVDPIGQVSYAVFSILHRLTSSIQPRRVPELDAERRRRLSQHLGDVPEPSDSDGFVPTLSQVWGTIISAAECDHLDLMGYYGRPPTGHAMDLLACGADFGAADFEAVWTAVARFGLSAPD